MRRNRKNLRARRKKRVFKKENCLDVSISFPRNLFCNSSDYLRNALSIPIQVAIEQSEETVETPALIDSGAGGKFIDQNFAKQFTIHKLDKPLKAYNVDGTENKRGKI